MKRVLFFLAIMGTILRGGALSIELFFPNAQMPLFVLVCNGILIALGAALVVVSLMNRLRIRYLQVYFIADVLFMLVSLFYFGSGSVIAEVRWYELALVGKLLQVILDLAILFFSFRRHRYIRIKSDFSGDAGEPPEA